MKAKEIIKNKETAVMIFTDGKNLEINSDGKGKSGVWRINKNASVEKVLIYFRNKSKNVNEIYLGNFIQLIPSTEKDYANRFAVKFDDMKFVGFTKLNWNEFTDTKQGAVSPVKYIR